MTTEPELEHPSPENARSPMKTWRLLFLDCQENIEELKKAGTDAGYVVVGAVEVAEAWAVLDGKDHVDVIVCAAHLEDESMFAFLAAVRANEVHRDARFLILSVEPSAAAAMLDTSTARSSRALGADAYAVMPTFDPAKLISLVSELQPAVPMLQQSSTPANKHRSE